MINYFVMTKDKNHININEIYDEVWNSLEIGVKDRFSDYHTFSLATLSNNKISLEKSELTPISVLVNL